MSSMKHLLSALVLGVLAGCYVSAADPSGGGAGAATGANAANETGGTVGDGLPCDVQKFLSAHCWSCHGAEPSSDAPNSLVTYDQLARHADEALARVKAGTMPPDAPLADGDYDALASWVDGGKPNDTCTDENALDPLFSSSETKCTSNTLWTRGDHGDDDMHPGRACIDCHSKSHERDAPPFVIAGTVFPTGHEPSDCNGGKGDKTAKVQVLDANKRLIKTAPVSTTSGNFYIRASSSFSELPEGATVQIVTAAGTRAMSDTPKSGDCNSCHTPKGDNEAPGRIVYPVAE